MLIKIKVFPGSKKESVEKKSEDSFAVYLREKAEKGMANKKLRGIIAAYFNVNEERIKIVQGGRSRNKIIDIL
jgi:uncharacterized protein YggU (UPF0235/DUF167 family)